MIISTLEELRLYFPAHALDSIDTMSGFIDNSENDVLKEKLGTALYNKVVEYYKDIEPDDLIAKVQDNEISDYYDKLLLLCQRIVAYDAFSRAIGVQVLSLNAAGVNVATADDYSKPDKDAIETYRLTCVREMHAAVNRLLITLEEWTKDTTTLATETFGVSGTSGESGEAGETGTSGESGSSGESGESGTSGESGETGTSGTSGTSGETSTPALTAIAEAESSSTTTPTTAVVTGSVSASGDVSATATQDPSSESEEEEEEEEEAEEEDDDQKEIVNLWKQSRFYYDTADLLIPNAVTLQQYLDFYENREKFIQMLPDLRYIHEDVIGEAVGEDFLAYLTLYANNGTTNNTILRSVHRLRKAMARLLVERTQVIKASSDAKALAHDEAVHILHSALEYMEAHQKEFDVNQVKAASFYVAPVTTATATSESSSTSTGSSTNTNTCRKGDHEEGFANNKHGNAFFVTPHLY